MDLNNLKNLESNLIGANLTEAVEDLWTRQGTTLAMPYDASNIDSHPDGTRIWATLTHLYAQTLYEVITSMGIEIAKHDGTQTETNAEAES